MCSGIYKKVTSSLDFHQVCLAKANSTSSLDTVVVQDLRLGEGQAVEIGDSLEVVYTGWLLQSHTIGQVTYFPLLFIHFPLVVASSCGLWTTDGIQVAEYSISFQMFDSNQNKDKLLRLKIGAGKVIRVSPNALSKISSSFRVHSLNSLHTVTVIFWKYLYFCFLFCSFFTVLFFTLGVSSWFTCIHFLKYKNIFNDSVLSPKNTSKVMHSVPLWPFLTQPLQCEPLAPLAMLHCASHDKIVGTPLFMKEKLAMVTK